MMVFVHLIQDESSSAQEDTEDDCEEKMQRNEP